MFSHLDSEIFFHFSRSSGSGGQNVNKVSTKVELNFDVANSKLLTQEQKQKISEKLFNRINKEGILKITVQESRSQFENKEIALKKFHILIASCFQKPKKRIHTKVTKSSKEKRIQQKKRKSEIKKWRREKLF
ncbi:MAG: alternative ribosome rescue aminoacyl-tRNA hydrolase ArfB [Bacteroidia bacterium]